MIASATPYDRRWTCRYGYSQNTCRPLLVIFGAVTGGVLQDQLYVNHIVNELNFLVAALLLLFLHPLGLM